MKRLGIDARLIGQTGVGVYIQNLLYHLPIYLPSDCEVYIFTLNGEVDKSINNEKYHFVKADYKWHTVSEQVSFLSLLNRSGLDLMHFTYLSYPFLYKKTFMSTIHDLTHLKYRSGKASTKNNLHYQIKYLAYKYVLSTQVKNSCEIIVPTNTIKKQIINSFGSQYGDKIHTVYEGVNINLTSAKTNKELGEKFDGDFLIYVGNFYPHKNIQSLIHAFKRARGSLKLILIGPQDYFAKRIKELIIELKLEKRVIIFHGASLSDLRFFYENAKGLVHPSLSEGFCLPLSEAVYFNLPIVASNIPVFQEVLGDNYLPFDPNSIDSITKGIEEFISKEKKINYEDLRSKYSFKEMAHDTAKLYKSYL